MTIRAVLDACVLFPFSLRDLLLRLAERELYDVCWSPRILDEMTRNLIGQGVITEPAARRLEHVMRGAFETAEVSGDIVERLEPAMANHPKDRHVLAAAVAADAAFVVTANLSDFPDAACEPLGVTAMHPDAFLLLLHARHPQVVVEVLTEQAGDLTNPPWSVEDLLDSLATQTPTFVAAVRSTPSRT